MNKTSSSFKFVQRFGTIFSQISFIGTLTGLVILLRGVSGHSNDIAIAVTFLIVGPSLLSISILIANKKIEIVENGKMTLGTYKEWRNSFITKNNQVLVYLIYTYLDDKRKKKEAYTLSGSTNAREKTHIFYINEDNVILEYLPGSPEFNERKEIDINIIPTIIKYIILLTIGCFFSIGRISL